MNEPSVGDVAAFEALPEEVQALARKVLGDTRVNVDAVEAYRLGWDNAVVTMIWSGKIDMIGTPSTAEALSALDEL